MAASEDSPERQAATLGSKLRNVTPIAISLIALGISAVSLYRSQFRPASIRIYPGAVAHLMTYQDNILRMNLSLSFLNSGAVSGVIRKISLLLQPTGKPDAYILTATVFDHLNENGTFVKEGIVGPIPVEAHQTVTKMIRFISDRDKPGDYLPLLERGEYLVTALVWGSDAPDPTEKVEFPFELSDRDITELNLEREGKSNESVELYRKQLHQWNAGVVNKQELRDLLVAAD